MIRLSRKKMVLALCPYLFMLFSSHAAVGAEEEFAPTGFDESTLAGIYELSVAHDQTIAQARAILRTGTEERDIALAGLLPNISTGYAYQTSDSENRGAFPAGAVLFPNLTDTQADTTVWNVSLNQPLFDVPAWFTFRQGVQLAKQAEAEFAVAQQDLLLRVVVAYFEVMRSVANLKASRAQESALKAQLDQVQQRFDVGLVAITDLEEARAGYDLAVAQRINDDGQLGINLELLSVLTGRPHSNLWMLKPAFPVINPEPVDREAWVEFARLNSLDVRVAEHARDAAQQGAKAARAVHLPKINLGVSYRDARTDVSQQELLTGIKADFPNDQKQSVAFVEVTLPLFSGGFISATRRQAVAFYDTQKASYAGIVRNTTQQTAALHVRVVSDVARSRAREQAVMSTQSALQAAETGFQVGTRNAVDVLRAQETHFSAVRDYDNSIVDYVQNLIRLKRLVGTLAPEDVYELNGWLERPETVTLSGRSSGSAP